MLRRSTIQLLRFHFSFFLLPVFLFALSQVSNIDTYTTTLLFFILHFLVYPSSNGFNSYMDRDESPIGGLKSPLQPTKQLYYLTILLDTIAILLALFISIPAAVGIILYIMASRAYSARTIRLKQFPIIGFLTVFIFQGALIFLLTFHAAQPHQQLALPWEPALISSCLIGALYPLTQVYQHEADRRDGVTTISYMLGKKGSFVFSLLLFLLANVLLLHYFREKDQARFFLLFAGMSFPVIAFFLFWMMRVWKREAEANFQNSLRMNVVSTICTSAFFITLFILNH